MTFRAVGARGRVGDPEEVLARAAAWGQARDVEVLLADARAVFGPAHLESAVRHAQRAKAAGTMAARTLALETLRYLSGQRQVSHAIRVAGIRPGTESIAVLVVPAGPAEDLVERLGWSLDDSVLEAAGKSLEVLGVSRREERTVPADRRPDLALEQTARLDVER